MKRFLFYLCAGIILSCATSSNLIAQNEKLFDGQKFSAMFNLHTSFRTPEGLVISPNFAPMQSSGTEDSSDGNAVVTIKGDTLTIKYSAYFRYDTRNEYLAYALPNKKYDVLVEKIETYYAKDYLENGGELIIDGKQSYYMDGKLFCEEIISNGELKSTKWYNSHGINNLTYVFKNHNLFQQLQLYPSNKLKYQEIYLASGNIQNVYDAAGKPAQLTLPTEEQLEDFQYYFNLFFTPLFPIKDKEVTVNMFVDKMGCGEAIVWDNIVGFPHKFTSNNTPIISPVTIDSVPVDFTFKCKVKLINIKNKEEIASYYNYVNQLLNNRFYPNGQLKYEFKSIQPNSHDKQLIEYYSTGEIKVVETLNANNGKVNKEYYSKQGKKVKPTLPKFSHARATLASYITDNIHFDNTILAEYGWETISGEVCVYVEVDENGHHRYFGIEPVMNSMTLSVTDLNTNPINKSGYDLLQIMNSEILPRVFDCIRNNHDESWIPGSIDGEAHSLRTQIRIPLTFKNPNYNSTEPISSRTVYQYR